MISVGGAQRNLQNVTKHKSIGPCVQDLRPKMRVNWAFADINNPIFILIWSKILIFGLYFNILTAIVEFIVFIIERIIFLLDSLFCEQKLRLTSFSAHIGSVWGQMYYHFSLGMINVNCCSQNLGLLKPNTRVFKKACPSDATIGWEVYPQYKHNLLFWPKKLSTCNV